MAAQPHVALTISELHAALTSTKHKDTTNRVTAGSDVQVDRAVVMTMGALHAGHMELVKQARARARQVVVTIFVNPLQFGPNEDFEAYPRTLDADLELLAEHGADVVFAPDLEEMYPGGDPLVRVTSGHLGTILEGASRPGHFDGVLTVVNKLLHLTKPQLAFFGQKDAQQLLLISRMVRDFNFDVEICAVPIVRQENGLALSSRNAYLLDDEKLMALTLYRALNAARDVAYSGGSVAQSHQAAHAVFEANPQVTLDYFVIVDPTNIGEVQENYVGEALGLVAARVGRTRLIDNMHMQFGVHE
ncbi:pantoate--beta-alanine ligase [Timonella sp. A28]|uniref:pantoate--beta-alanine ligase n=1 Tax=Timonella sp. A28 TaxID=3442640 RepID=UPI003EBC13B1